MVKELLERVKNGTASAGDLSVARAILRDNNIQATPRANPALMGLADQIPLFNDNA